MSKLIKSEYDGLQVQFNTDAWFNATTVAAKFNKESHEWLRLKSTEDYIKALARKHGEIPYSKTTRGKNGGTWLHPKLG